MQLCSIFEGSSFCSALDFVAGYPAIEGKLTHNPFELIANQDGNSSRWYGRMRCVSYAIAHGISIPLSPLVALVRIVVMPIFFGILFNATKTKLENKKLEVLGY